MSTDDRTPARSAAKRALLEQRLIRRAPGAATRIPVRAQGSAPPLSFAQERVWFMEQYAPGTTAYATPVLVRLRGRLDRDALQSALDALVERHEPLRMTFPAGPDGTPEVRIAATALPLRELDAPPGAALDALRAAAAAPFDLAGGPLMRALVVRLGERDHLLLMAGHHIIGDGWSGDVLVADLMELYRAARTGTASALPALPVRYGDFARWQRDQVDSIDHERHARYWSDRLAGLGPLELPTDRPRPAVQTFTGATHPFTIDAELTTALGTLGRVHGATLFMTVLAGYQALLSRHGGGVDFGIGTPVAGRSRPELEGLVGMFVTMLALRTDLAGDPAFTQVLARSRRTVFDALTHQDMPFERIVADLGVERDVSRSPLFQATFALHNFSREQPPVGPAVGELTAAGWRALDLPATRFDLELHASPVGGALACGFTYNTGLFDETTIARLAERFVVLLRHAVAEPDTPLSRLELLTPDDRGELLAFGTGERVPVPAGSLADLIGAQAARTPGATALVAEEAQLTYAELTRRANRVAHRLRAGGAGPRTLVAVYAERSVELVVGLLGVLKAGAAYLPLDPDHPVERLEFMLTDAGAPLVLTQRRLAGALPATDAEVLVLDDPAPWADQPDTDPATTAGPDDPAYLIYTSGSTGRPKGVLNTHAGIVNRLDWMQRAFPLTAADAVLQKTPAGFDVSVWEFFWPLLNGARVVLARPGGHRDPAYLRDLIVGGGVSVAHFVPSMLAAFADEDGIEVCRGLHQVICSGEELPAPTVTRFAARLPDCRVHNLYGPTEAAVDVSWWAVDPDAPVGGNGIPIGRPIQNTDLHVLDDRMAAVPPGVAGELHIGGVGLAEGYWRRPGLTADRFVPDPFGPPGARLYRTGDRARWVPDGALEFLGRTDHQVKLRGVRIEPGEIEARMRAEPGVREAVVAVRRDGPAGPQLVGYLVGDADPATVRAALRAALPDTMVPAALVVLAAMPVTANGKLDRAALPAPAAVASATGYVAPSTPGQRLVAGVWADVLGADRVGAEDDFFDLGGHSMLATRVVARLRTALAGTGRSVGVMDVFTHRTVAALATLVEGDSAAGPRRLLYELTRPVPPDEQVRSLVCLPYGGGSAVVYQPLADALPAGHTLHALAIPGHDVGLDEEPLPFLELAERATAEILDAVQGPTVLYGHCGVGGALVVEVARRLEAAGHDLQAVYVGAIFPFARPGGTVSRLLSWIERRRSNRQHAAWLTGRGVDLAELDPAQADRIIANMRADGDRAEAYFGELLDERVEPLRAPVISVIGERDPATDYYRERFREWHFLTGHCAVVVLDEAGHFFLKYRAEELAEIVTGVHPALGGPGAADLTESARPDAGWWLHAESERPEPDAAAEIRPSMRRFGAVAAGQLVSMAGSALTAWAIPVWIYLATGSLVQFSLFAVSGLVPALLVGPLAGAVVDRSSRRRVMAGSGAVAGGAELVLGLLFWGGQLQPWHLYAGVAVVASALAFQRLAFVSAIPQLVPKRYLGNANGIAQLLSGFAMLLVPLAAAGLLAALGLGTILLLDVLSYAAAIGVLALTRFPDTLGHHRREPLLTEIAAGFRYSWGNPALRAMLLFSAMVNVFLGPALILVTPLVLAFAELGALGWVSFAEAIGALVGGLVFTVWGGPARRRMRGLLVATLVLAACCAVTGLRPSVVVVAAGVFGTAASLAVIQSIYATIVQVKVPQRFHGRVFALNQMIAWSTLPLGYAVLAPLASAALQPLVEPDGALAGTVGLLYGVGDGRGIGLVYAVVAIAVAVLTVAGMRTRTLSRFDTDVPDALPDDLVGVRALRARQAGSEQRPQ